MQSQTHLYWLLSVKTNFEEWWGISTKSSVARLLFFTAHLNFDGGAECWWLTFVWTKILSFSMNFNPHSFCNITVRMMCALCSHVFKIFPGIGAGGSSQTLGHFFLVHSLLQPPGNMWLPLRDPMQINESHFKNLQLMHVCSADGWQCGKPR